MAQDRQDSSTAGRPLFGIPVVARRIGLCVATGAVSLVLISACGSSSGSAKTTPSVGTSSAATSDSAGTSSSASATGSTASTDSSATTASAMIMIDKFKYTTPLTVSPGAMVSVMNIDGENHTVTADSGNAFDDMATAGQTTTFKAPMTPGSYPYHCTYHSNMHGVLIVK